MITILHGLSMGIANSVPGVSGGTIAFILGFYDRFINSVNNIISKDKNARKDAIFYLIKLLGGLAVGIGICILLLTRLFELHVYSLCSAFIGLTIAAIPFVVFQEKETLKGKYYNAYWAVIGVAVVVCLSVFRSLGASLGSINFITGLTPIQYLYVFLAGLLGISAMVLPGISGSTILLVFGVYIPVLNAVKEIIRFHWSVQLIAGVFVFCLGMLVGIVLSMKIIKVSLEKFRKQMVWFILGLMGGSVYAIMMGPTTLEPAQAAMTVSFGKPDSIRFIALLLGAAILVALELIKKSMEKKKDAKPKAE